MVETTKQFDDAHKTIKYALSLIRWTIVISLIKGYFEDNFLTASIVKDQRY